MTGVPRATLLGDPGLVLGDDGVPRSTRFGDLYFSAQDGLAETRHTFLDGIALEALLARPQPLTIAELGFGTGLNMAATLAAWASGPRAPLGLISIEGYPLSPDALAASLKRWHPALGFAVERLVAAYPLPAPGVHRVCLGPDGAADSRVTLTLMFGPVVAMLEALVGRVDAWFLDGFAPARNPEMWSAEVLTRVARASRPGARLATFTAAGAVRRGLEAVGFVVTRRPGHGAKRHCLAASLEPRAPGPAPAPRGPAPAPTPRGPDPAPAPRAPCRALVIGAGIAGACAAAALARRGWHVAVWDQAPHPAAAASGNPVASVAPRLTLDDSPAGRFYAAAFGHAVRLYRALGLGDGLTGAAELAPQPEDPRRLQRLGAAGTPASGPGAPGPEAGITDTGDPAAGPGPGGGALLGPGQALWQERQALAHRLGVALAAEEAGGLWLAQAGTVRPTAVIARLLETPGVTLASGRGLAALVPLPQGGGWRALAQDGAAAEVAVVVLAAGMGLASPPRLTGDATASLPALPLSARRGQVTVLQAPALAMLRHAVSFGHYLAPLGDGTVLTGATFDPVPPQAATVPPAASAADDARNLAALEARLGAGALADARILDHRAGLRATTADRLPFAGRWPLAAEGLLTLGGLGARGFTTAPLLAQVIAALAEGSPLPVETKVWQALDPGRFAARLRGRAAGRGG